MVICINSNFEGLGISCICITLPPKAVTQEREAECGGLFDLKGGNEDV
jgi:hypothetical protein